MHQTLYEANFRELTRSYSLNTRHEIWGRSLLLRESLGIEARCII